MCRRNKATTRSGETESLITSQLEKGLVNVDQTNLVIAYEPIWAIGTGDTCETSEANRVIGVIRKQLKTPMSRFSMAVQSNRIILMKL